MSAKLYKLVYDISVFYTIGAFLLKCLGGISLDIRLFLALLISMCIIHITERRRSFKTLLTIMFPTASLLLLVPSIPDIVIFLLAWAFYSYVSITKRGLNSRGEFIDVLKYTSSFYLLLLLLILAIHPKIGEGLTAACPYFILSLVSTVFLLRSLRIDNKAVQWKSYHRYQFLELLSFLIISLLLALIKAPQNILYGLQLVYQYLLSPILSFLAWAVSTLLSGIIYLAIALFHLITNNKGTTEVKLNLGSTTVQSAESTNTMVLGHNWMWSLIYSTGAIIGIIILFFFFRRLMGRKLKQLFPMGISETREYIADSKDKNATLIRRKPNDPREAVRYYYLKDIFWLQHKKVMFRQQDTTEDINHKCLNLIQEEVSVKCESSTELMQLYRKARYQMSEPISRDDAEKAKKLYLSIIKSGKI